MKKIHFHEFLLALLISTVITLIFGCKEKPSQPVDDGNDIFKSVEFAVPDIDDELATFEIENGTIDSPITLRPFREPDECTCSYTLPEILRELQLNDWQIIQIKVFIANSRDSVIKLKKRVTNVKTDIIKDANEKRDVILDELSNGDITRQQATRKINVLNDETRDRITNLRERYCLALKSNRDNLFGNISNILEDDQKKLWSRWVNSLSDCSCTFEEIITSDE